MLQYILQLLIWVADKVWPVPIVIIGCYIAWHVVRVVTYRLVPSIRQRRSGRAIPLLIDVLNPFWWIIPLIISFILTLVTLSAAENAVVWSVNKLVHQTQAEVISREVADVEVNYKKNYKLPLNYETEDGRMIEASYLSSSYPYYPIRDTYRLPFAGEMVDIKYLPYRPSVFIILQD